MQRLCYKYTVSSKVKSPALKFGRILFDQVPHWNIFASALPFQANPPFYAVCSICSAHFLSVVSLPHKFKVEKIKKGKVYIFILKLVTTMQLDDISSLHSTTQRIFLQYEMITWECENWVNAFFYCYSRKKLKMCSPQTPLNFEHSYLAITSFKIEKFQTIPFGTLPLLLLLRPPPSSSSF